MHWSGLPSGSGLTHTEALLLLFFFTSSLSSVNEKTTPLHPPPTLVGHFNGTSQQLKMNNQVSDIHPFSARVNTKVRVVSNIQKSMHTCKDRQRTLQKLKLSTTCTNEGLNHNPTQFNTAPSNISPSHKKRGHPPPPLSSTRTTFYPATHILLQAGCQLLCPIRRPKTHCNTIPPESKADCSG